MIHYGETEREHESCNGDFERYEAPACQMQDRTHYFAGRKYYSGSSNYFQINRVGER